MAICEHLDAYGVQFTKTEAAYRQCNHLVQRIQNEGARQDLVGLLQQALSEWKSEDKKLRGDFVILVKEGEINLPKKANVLPCCSSCGTSIPKLKLVEWEIAHNGVAELNGEELPQPQLV